MSATYFPAVLPPSSAVAGVSPEAAKAVRTCYEFEMALPPMPSPAQVNELDKLRSAALEQLGDEFVAKLADEKAQLLSALADDVSSLRARWYRLEEIGGLEHWRSSGQRSFSPRVISVMKVTLGNGYTQSVMGRDLLRAFADSIELAGR